jgi:hypothetical protein
MVAPALTSIGSENKSEGRTAVKSIVEVEGGELQGDGVRSGGRRAGECREASIDVDARRVHSGLDEKGTRVG